ncbi:hypothetical protein [Parabacteroides sp.]
MTRCFFIVTIRGGFPIELRLERNNSFAVKVVRMHEKASRHIDVKVLSGG